MSQPNKPKKGHPWRAWTPKPKNNYKDLPEPRMPYHPGVSKSNRAR